MHLSNFQWWIYASGRWANHFNNARVLEIGSYSINGTIRPIFRNCDYTGLDWRPGPYVDIVSLAHEFKWDKTAPFDAIVSASMLEHDPYWESSLRNVIPMLDSEHGALFLSWGSADNPRHCAPECPDYEEAKKKNEHMTLHHALPAWNVVDLLLSMGFVIQEFRYEDDMPFNQHLYDGFILPGCRHSKAEARCPVTCKGGVCLVAFANDSFVKSPVFIDKYKGGDIREV